ncbi:MAG: peptidase [Alphaproteobacteria bacterium]|nr:peptidase [Alphaproteobacteria bacterium]
MPDTPLREPDAFADTRAFLEKHGYPRGDLWDRPISDARFPDGAHFRIEVPTVNSADAVRTLVRIVREESGVTINRIDQTAGIMRFSDKEHEAYLDVGREHDIEIFFALGPRGIYDIGAQKMVNSVWGHASALRTRGMEQIVYAIEDVKRIVGMGGRGLLISDEGMLILAKKLRDDGVIPSDVKLMASAHMGHNNPVTYKMLEDQGADTIASQRDLDFSIMAALRAAVQIPLHVHIDNPQATGGFIRVYDAPEMVRICAPVYLKTGSSVLERHGMVITEDLAVQMGRQVAVSMETLRRYLPDAIQTEGRAEDLAIPV